MTVQIDRRIRAAISFAKETGYEPYEVQTSFRDNGAGARMWKRYFPDVTLEEDAGVDFGALLLWNASKRQGFTSLDFDTWYDSVVDIAELPLAQAGPQTSPEE